MHAQKLGFTLIELLVVMTIIGVLASVVLAGLETSRETARKSTATQQLVQVRTGLIMLLTDTGKAPNGCPYGRVANPEVRLTDTRAGLISRPIAGDNTGGCIWTATDVANWNGPYILVGMDPWGRSYWYDPDFSPFRNCPSETTLATIPAVVSLGRDGAWYTCDDIYVQIR